MTDINSSKASYIPYNFKNCIDLLPLSKKSLDFSKNLNTNIIYIYEHAQPDGYDEDGPKNVIINLYIIDDQLDGTYNYFYYSTEDGFTGYYLEDHFKSNTFDAVLVNKAGWNRIKKTNNLNQAKTEYPLHNLLDVKLIGRPPYEITQRLLERFRDKQYIAHIFENTSKNDSINLYIITSLPNGTYNYYWFYGEDYLNITEYISQDNFTLNTFDPYLFTTKDWVRIKNT